LTVAPDGPHALVPTTTGSWYDLSPLGEGGIVNNNSNNEMTKN